MSSTSVPSSAPEGLRHDAFWGAAARRLAVLQFVQVSLIVVMALGMVAAVVLLGGQIRTADADADRAGDEVTRIVEARDELRRFEVDFWSNFATGEVVYRANDLVAFVALIDRIKRLADAQAASRRDAATRERRQRMVSSVGELLATARAAARRNAIPNAREGAEVLNPVNAAMNAWVESSKGAASDARMRSEELTERLIMWLAAAISLLAVVGIGLWLIIGRLRARMVAALRAAEGRFRSLIQDVVLVVDGAGEVTYASPSVERTLGYGQDELRGTLLTDLATQDDAVDVDRLVEQADGGGDLVTWLLRRSDGSRLPVEVLVTDLRDDPMIGGLVLNCRDITERIDAEARLEHQAFHDPLTDLPNRTLFEDRLAHALLRARRSGSSVAVVFLDLDDFKTVNDSLGHAAGDRLLVWAAERITAVIRETDTAARLGGDEFAVVLEGAGDEDVVARRITEALGQPIEIDGHEVAPQASVGIARAEEASTADSLMRQADVAMYAAKADGKGRRVVFREEMEEAAHDRMALKSELRRALSNGEFRMSYQPIVDVVSGHPRFVEALLRWDHPERGEVPPVEFIPLAEETGLIRPIGAWALEEACREAARWHREFGSAAPALSVNLSAHQLDDPEMRGLVEHALARTGLMPAELILEITESVLMSDVDAARRELEELAAIGVRTAIDDFGVGNSSLRYLGRLPVDIVKVDRSFVDRIAEDERDAHLAESIFNACDAFGLVCAIEGVESAEQARELERIGFHLAQGFYYSRPVTADRLLDVMGARLPRDREPVEA
ncbi:MAG: putative bifunctional diguanylate cyclase/phosphodiesterase [Miltoncostaeaceae bacterium]